MPEAVVMEGKRVGRTKNGVEIIPPKQNDTRLYLKLLNIWGLKEEDVERIEKGSKIKLKNILDYEELLAEIMTSPEYRNI